MTNPNDGVGTNAGFNGRTTPKALNDILQGWNGAGVISGWTCSPKSGMTVQIGGDGSVRDTAIAENNAGDRTTIDNRLATPVEITLSAAPATGNRYDSIVAYVDGSQIGTGASDVDFPSITGIIAVSGTAANSPTKPTENQIRTAITADGADGTTAYYVVLADILVGQGVTTIGSGVITQGTKATTIAAGSITSDEIQNNAIIPSKVNFSLFKLPTPDYTAAQNFTTTTYTAPADGWVQVAADLSHQTGTEASLALNIDLTRGGTTLTNAASFGFYSQHQYQHAYPRLMLAVRAGDSITLTATNLGSWQARRFFPVKWN